MNGAVLKAMTMKRSESGFTVIELIFTVAIVAMVVAAIYQLLYFVQNSWARDEVEAQQLQTADVAIASMSRALRGIVVPSPSLSAIEVAGKNEMTFYSDIDSDEKPEKVHYLVSGGNLIMGISRPTSGPPWTYGGSESQTIVARDLVNDASHPLFRYFDSTQTEFTPVNQADRDRIKVIKITPRVGIGRNANPTQIETDIAPRNLN